MEHNKLYFFSNQSNYSNKNNNKVVKYSFSFTSLITPLLLSNIRFVHNSVVHDKKIWLKQSYILLTWFYYLSFINYNKKKIKLVFFTLPIQLKKFTQVKSPMAHKNWSKEQYKFQFYKFKISFINNFLEDNNITSINNSLMFILLSKKNLFLYETNIFFLKNFNVFFFYKDNKFFNYNYCLFLNNR